MTTQDPADAVSTASGLDEHFEFDGEAVLYAEQVEPQHGVLGLTLRELLIVGVWLIAFVVSFFPVFPGGASLWSSNIDWLLPIGVPTAAVFLIVLRRFSPDGIRRVGSLGIDQFASVAFSVAALWWIQQHWSLISRAVAANTLPFSWVHWVELVAMLGLVVLTVFAPFIGGLRDDFQGRMETLAHRNADPVRPVVARVAQPAAADAAVVETTDASSDDEAAASDVEESLASAAPTAADEPDADDTAAAHVADDADVADAADDMEGPDADLLRIESILGLERVDPIDEDLPAQTNATDEIQPLDQPARVPLSAHASGGGTGTVPLIDAAAAEQPARRLRRSTGSLPIIGEHAAASDEAARTESGSQLFWALAPVERDVLDEQGKTLFRIGPTAWALVIEDRGDLYVIRHDDGRIGYLHDITDITKG